MDEMHTSVVTARRLAADRTIELTRMQDHLNQVQRRLDEATARIAELEKQSAAERARPPATSGPGSGRSWRWPTRRPRS